MFLTDFQILRPRFESNQEETLDWIVDAHVMAQRDEGVRTAIREKLWHVGCKPDRISKRGHVLSDFLHRNWEEMEVYRLGESPSGMNLFKRTQIYQSEVDQIFETYFPPYAIPPDDLIHVSCTGYVSPSGAQKIVSKRNWGDCTTVTHAYHMGCYASIPALRIGKGFLSLEKKKIDVVHTELCSLHSNPSKHQTDQLVSQSLFADGFMKYSLVSKNSGPSIEVISLREEIIPESTEAMTWDVADWGFQMSLAKEIPVLITRHLEGYLSRLCPDGIAPHTLFAIHPGGPKILTHIQKLLQLKDEQMAFSFEILKEYGNMSSATLPHVWERILKSAAVPPSTPIISLAFGPGLTVAGAFMVKRCGS